MDINILVKMYMLALNTLCVAWISWNDLCPCVPLCSSHRVCVWLPHTLVISSFGLGHRFPVTIPGATHEKFVNFMPSHKS